MTMSMGTDGSFTRRAPSTGRSATFGKLSGERFAEVRASAAAVFRQEQHQIAQGLDIRALDHLPPALFRNDEAGGNEYREVAGKRALTES